MDIFPLLFTSRLLTHRTVQAVIRRDLGLRDAGFIVMVHNLRTRLLERTCPRGRISHSVHAGQRHIGHRGGRVVSTVLVAPAFMLYCAR